MASILSLVSWTAIPSTQFTLDDSHRARHWGKNKTRLLPRPAWSSLLLWLLPPTPWPISELLLFKGWGPVLLPQNKQDIAKNKDIASSYPFDHLSHTCCTSGSIRVSKRSWHSLSDICQSVRIWMASLLSYSSHRFLPVGPPGSLHRLFQGLALPWILAASRPFSYPWQTDLLLWLTCA